MLTLNNIEKKEALDKPFTNIRFVVDPPEGIKALGIKLKEPTLFVEVVHGKGTDVLKEWILLHLKHELKTPVDQKTRYGKKIELKDLNDSGLESASPKRDFDLQQIENYLYPRTQRNKLIPSIRSAPGSTTSDRATLCIPTSSGECRLVFTPEGNVCLDRVPTDLDLKIETPGSIKTGADLKCYSVCLVGKNIQNAYSFEADTMNITAEKKLINEGKLSGKNAVVVSAGEALINQPNAILISENGLMQIKDTPHLTNQGEIHGAKQLEISTPTCLNNASKGTLTSDLHLNLSLSASHNHGQMSARTIVLSGAALENSTEGKILGDNIHIVGNTVLDNSGRVKAKQALSIKTNTNLTNNAKGT
ncbi:MAG TPA: hypothetical protein VGU44_03370, partial [Gammaproteobacteria bacterium]|nr:hypothetical protein [Gammaproteobacteria bacterium]